MKSSRNRDSHSHKERFDESLEFIEEEVLQDSSRLKQEGCDTVPSRPTSGLEAFSDDYAPKYLIPKPKISMPGYNFWRGTSFGDAQVSKEFLAHYS
jgi:hypothetical protein